VSDLAQAPSVSGDLAAPPDLARPSAADLRPVQMCVGGGYAQNGSPCSFYDECCSGSCGKNGRCCGVSGQVCDFNNDQCCDGARCDGPTGRCCAQPQTHCATANDCCSGLQCGTICPIGMPCQSSRCCVPPSQPCSSSLDCCGDQPSQCYQGKCCVSGGYKCTKDEDCCGVTCKNGIC
jgi:hypothetical protein